MTCARSRASSASHGPADEAGQRPRRAARSARRQVWDGAARASTARASRSPSSTPASTTPTPTSAVRARPPPTSRHAAETAAGRTRRWFGPAAPRGQGRHRPRRRQLQRRPDERRPTSRSRTRTPNPLDCNGHGTHVAGTAAGFGVLPTARPTPARTTPRPISRTHWIVGPGVAPKADLYAIRVFGCEGSTDVVVDAIEWAVDHDMDVINMSLGSPFGGADEPDAVAADNAAKAGVIVVASAGNAGPNPYITGSPASGTGAISVAASDPTPSFPGANVALSTGAQPSGDRRQRRRRCTGPTLPIKVLRTARRHHLARLRPGRVHRAPAWPARSSSCSAAPAPASRGRSSASRPARPRCSWSTTSTALPPYEGPITSEPRHRRAVQRDDPVLRRPRSERPPDARSGPPTAARSTLTDHAHRQPGLPRPSRASPRAVRASGDSCAEARRHRAGREHRLGRHGHRQRLRDPVRHVDGLAAHRRRGRARPAGAPDVEEGGVLEGRHLEHGRPEQGRGLHPRVAGAGLIQVPAATKTQVVALGNKPMTRQSASGSRS